MTKVRITPNKTTGAIVTQYTGNSKYGYIMLSQESSVMSNGWLKTSTLRTIIKGQINALTQFVNNNPSLEIEGQLIVKEFVEDAVPEAIASAHFDKMIPIEDQIKNYIKTAGEGGPTLVSNGKRILRFTLLDPTGEDESVIVQHDNVAEVAAFNNSKKSVSTESVPDDVNTPELP